LLYLELNLEKCELCAIEAFHALVRKEKQFMSEAQYWRCVGICPEVDQQNDERCTTNDLQDFADRNAPDGCPCGNYPVWVKVGGME
jgi:hypothetical protein